MSLPKCNFDRDKLIAKVGNIYKGFRELECIQVPVFKKMIKEKEDLGGGWYSSKSIMVEKTFDGYYVIMENDKPFGVIYCAYPKDMKS